MDITLFRENLLADVAVAASADGNFSHSAFVDVAIDMLAQAGHVTDFEPCYYRGVSGRRNVGIDGYAFDKADSSLRVFIADAVLSREGSTLTQTDARALFGRLRALLEDALLHRLDDTLDENSPAREFSHLFQLRAPQLSRIRAYLLTDGTLSAKVRDWPEDNIGDLPVEFHIWDITRFFRAQMSLTGQEEIVVDFASLTDGNGIPCISASIQDEDYAGYLCVIPGSVLADVYDNFGSRLLEGNVRSFLTARGKVNRKIRNTLLKEPGMFFAYNNGIAGTATSVTLQRCPEGLAISSATDFQIVNGGQTTASLSAGRRNDRADLSETFIPMKLSVISAERAPTIIPLISEYANSQNKVSEADFFSNHEFHRRLEGISRRVWVPARAGGQHETHWFYERARGQYLNEMATMTAAQRRRFMEANPKAQVITKTDLAKFENSWSELPHMVSRGAQTNFLSFAHRIKEEWDADKARFNDAYFRAVVAHAILFRRTESIILEQPWYSGGYRANIVTYTIARISHEIARTQIGALNTEAIWQSQMLPQSVVDQIRDTSRIVYSNITQSRAGFENITQWCKREQAWLEVKLEPIELLESFISELTPLDVALSQDRAAKALQKIDSGLEARMAVMELGTPYWHALAEWASGHHLLSETDAGLLNLAQRDGMVPTDRQASRLLMLRRRFEDDGFNFLTESA